jgi:hypothetical protein
MALPVLLCTVEKYLEKWNFSEDLENYRLQESSLDKLFFELCPQNNKIEDILLKVATLNDFYSTNIFSVYPVAKHILSLNIDDLLKKGDESIVSKIQGVTISNTEKQMLYEGLYNELPDGATILFPESRPDYLATRGTVAGLQRLSRDSRFTKGNV